MLGFVANPHFGKSLVWCLVPMQVSVGILDLGVPPIGLTYFGALLYLFDNDIGLWVTFTLDFYLDKLTFIST